MWNQPLVQRRVDSVHGNLTQIRANFVDVNCHLPQGVRAVHRYLGDAAAPTERHHRGDGTDDRRLRRDVVEHYVARIVLLQCLVQPVQHQFVTRPREGKRPLLDALRAERRERRGLDAAVGVGGQQDRAFQLTPAPEDDRGRDGGVLDQSRFGSRRTDGVGRGGRRILQVGVERSRKVLVVRLREPARAARLRRGEHRLRRRAEAAVVQACDAGGMVVEV